MISAIQMSAKAMKRAVENVSLKRNTPSTSIIVGAMYCRNPIIAKGICFAPLANNNKGMAVAITAPINKNPVPEKKLFNEIDCDMMTYKTIYAYTVTFFSTI